MFWIESSLSQAPGDIEVRCVKVTWEREFADDPVLSLSELRGHDYETRKVQFYRDGRSECVGEGVGGGVFGHVGGYGLVGEFDVGAEGRDLGCVELFAPAEFVSLGRA